MIQVVSDAAGIWSYVFSPRSIHVLPGSLLLSEHLRLLLREHFTQTLLHYVNSAQRWASCGLHRRWSGPPLAGYWTRLFGALFQVWAVADFRHAARPVVERGRGWFWKGIEWKGCGYKTPVTGCLESVLTTTAMRPSFFLARSRRLSWWGQLKHLESHCAKVWRF